MKLLGLVLLVVATQFTFAAEEGNWYEKIKMSGNLRLRHDYVQKDGVADRHRERFRLRIAANAKVNEAMNAKVRLATGDNADPISANATMTDNGSKKTFYVDLAYLNWKVSDHLTLDIGKQENTFRMISNSQLVFDSDYNPEGASAQFSLDKMFLKLGGFSLKENKPEAGNSGSDSWLMSALAGIKGESESGVSYLVAAGYHDFTSLKDHAALKSSEADQFYSNSEIGSRYVNDYKVAEIMTEISMKFSGAKLSFFADGIMNNDITEENKGLLAGTSLAILDENDKADWTFTYNYRTIEKDATVSVINDSNFASAQDGSNGHTLVINKVVMENAQLGISYFMANVDNGGSPYSTQRGFVDLQVSF